jgi:type IV secretory pathway VirB2 component (pilin)
MEPLAVAVTLRGVLLASMAGAAACLLPAEAWPSSSPPDTVIGTTICKAASWMTGPAGVALATIGVSILGILAILGKLVWGTALLSGIGVSIIFGAPAILGTASCPNSSGYSGTGGLGPYLGVSRSIPYINLLSVGVISLSTSHIGIWPGNLANEIGLTTGEPTLENTTKISTANFPVIGWLQIVYTLPPGFSISPAFANQGYGVDSNGNSYIMEGFINASGDGQYTGWLPNNVYLYQNGQIYAGSSPPPNLSVQYELYDNWSYYADGCTMNCALAGQSSYTYNTSQGGGFTSSPNPTSARATIGRCTTGTCNAPPL